ncbi:ChbG/HpnK family deacetylase [bacterium]|nr:ChbG/HpnK family deacetylase [bacterium]
MIKTFLIIPFLMGLTILCPPAKAWSPAPADTCEIRLIVRGDDFGMTQGSLMAFERAFKEGILTCGGMIVPGPWFEGAAELSRKNPGWCVGVHLAVIGEWMGCRWRPVLPWDQVRSIVDEDGFLFTSPSELMSHHPRLEDIKAEFKAQIELALKKGVTVRYMDIHYLNEEVFKGIPGLDTTLLAMAAHYGIPFSGNAGEQSGISLYTDPVDRKLESALKNLKELKPGLTLWVCHIGIDSPEQNAMIHTKPEDRMPEPGVGRHRASELDVLLHPDVRALIRERGIRLVNYSELQKGRR